MPTDIEHVLTDEVRLLLACLRWPQTPESLSTISQIASSQPDWHQLLSLATHHRVRPLVLRNLNAAQVQMPAEVHALFKEAATQNAYAAMRFLAEAVRVIALLERQGIRARLLKGVPLSMTVYGEAGLRDVGDLDLLIAPEAEERADQMLERQGWRRIEPAARLTPRRRSALRSHAKDYTYDPPPGGLFELDLHWRLFRNLHLRANGLAAPEHAQEMELGAHRLAVLPPENTLLHLCFHGALEGWLRFKSLADVAALWFRFDEAQRGCVMHLARHYDAVAELTAALVLARMCGLLDGNTIPAPISIHEADAAVLRITGYALRLWARSGFRAFATTGGSWGVKRYEWSLRRDLPYRGAIAKRVLFRPRMWSVFDLPDAFYPLYPLLSPIEWAMFRVRRSGLENRNRAPRRAQSRWHRIWRAIIGRPLRDLLLLGEAAFNLLLARAALRLVPVQAIARWLKSGVAGAGKPDGHPAVDRVRWAVITAARYSPLRFVCFPQALAGHAMLRRRRIASEVVYGVRRGADGCLHAHTWLKVDDSIVLGGETAPHFFPVSLTSR